MSRRLPEHPMADGPRLADHPRAQRSIARAKAVAGIAGLLLTLLLALRVRSPLDGALAKALAAGLAAYFVAWCVAVVVWTQIARSELDARRRQLLARRDASR